MKSRFIRGKNKKLKAAMFSAAFILLCLSIYNFTNVNTPISPPPVNQDKFLIGAMQTYSPENNFTYYNTAGLNFMHYYVSAETGRPGYGSRCGSQSSIYETEIRI